MPIAYCRSPIKPTYKVPIVRQLSLGDLLLGILLLGILSLGILLLDVFVVRCFVIRRFFNVGHFLLGILSLGVLLVCLLLSMCQLLQWVTQYAEGCHTSYVCTMYMHQNTENRNTVKKVLNWQSMKNNKNFSEFNCYLVILFEPSGLYYWIFMIHVRIQCIADSLLCVVRDNLPPTRSPHTRMCVPRWINDLT